ncbi:MAG: alanine--tRNA ligase-related protein [candidate division KSB1 bacterium]|nr:alanine--tRNA ligase-related protein [candidate division KSB1 bacterium]MDZ7294572.1 alanine--tRNA ligase-related protein [candidate division KSB1 bacterium]MDZ7379703.1 alanine--tRNA ligase-related protein [candidate division KSB1 bacterium]MDZ7386015.1 alanine--tRNA ligase-related protein [candidate division KSB1 bacterium]MDZ7392382.1 alanine--tRNA ligase-related protein [candidate division KSB1 bacterium]
MTERLYWADAYLREFDAQILEARPSGEGCQVVLDRTAFYPTSGGQMHDTGLLAGLSVEDVVERDGDVVHFVRGHVTKGATVHCALDWPRRFDFMQQHTAFHLLAQAFLRVAGAHTLSSHLGEEMSTLELDTAEVSQAVFDEVEDLANVVVWENRPVRTYIVQPEEARGLTLRKEPKVEGPVRLVEVEEFDLDPCSGTHVAATGEVGLIKIVGKEKLRGHVRLRFLAGARALRDFRRRVQTLDQLSAELTTGTEEILTAVQKLRSQHQVAAKQLRAAQERFLEAIRGKVLASSPRGLCLPSEELNGIEWALVRKLAFQLLADGVETVVMMQSAPEVRIAVGTKRAGVDLRALLPELCAMMGAKGGGRPDFVELAGGDADRLALATALLKTKVEGLTPGDASSQPGSLAGGSQSNEKLSS